MRRLELLILFCCGNLFCMTMNAIEPFRIQIVDESNGWPVPLVEVRTTHNVQFVSDNAGLIAFDLPELMNRETWLDVRSHGYSVAKDGFGYSGVRVVPSPGGSTTIKVQRELAAKRLGRITGAGIFAESHKLAEHTDWAEQGILGCDSVQNAVHNGKMYWGWGDTTLANYPLGRFHMIGAVTETAPIPTLVPPIKLRYDYFTAEDGIPRNVAQMPGDGPTWLGGYASLPDQSGQKHLVATYAKIKPPLEEYEKGLCIWNEQSKQFDKHKVLWRKTEQAADAAAAPHGHVVIWEDQSGQAWVLFGDPFPTLKCRATLEDWADPEKWQSLTAQQTVASRDGQTQVRPHRGSIAWNDYRKRWITIFTQLYGDRSALGEIWYAEADAPTGPWEDAVKVVTHQNYTFYNPKLHPEFTPTGSPILLFEATYTHTFSKTTTPTPRHDYNQVLYRLDLNEIQN